MVDFRFISMCSYARLDADYERVNADMCTSMDSLMMNYSKDD